MRDSLFTLARADAGRDRRIGLSFWIAGDQERSIRKQFHSEVQTFAGRNISEDDYAVRGMLVANSQRDYYYSRFSREALTEAAELLPGAPALYGHDTRGVPVGRIFHARVTRIEDPNLDSRDQHWLEALYYVPRDADGEAHLRRVDLGIFREVSISWRCSGQDCGVCGRSIHSCPHIPGDIYDERGFCDYEFSGITAAMEVSHVYRGGQKDTSTFVPTTEGGGEGAPGVDGAPALAAGRLMRSCPPGTLDVDPAMLIEAKRRNGAMLHVDDVETWLRSERAMDFMGFSFGQPGQRGNVQRLSIDQSRFNSVAAAKRWARGHDFRVDRQRTEGMSLAFEQQDASQFLPDGWREIQLDRGVHAVVGKRDQNARERKAREATNTNDDALELWLREAASGANR